MSTMKITMLGLQNALTWKNQSLFDNLNLPSGIDKDTVIDNILLEGGEFEVLYADPYFMRAAIGTWSSKHYRTFEKWITALNIEYNPLENYDRQENWTDTLDSDTTNQNSTSDTNNRTVNNAINDTSNVNVDTSTTGTLDDTESTENTISAFDSNSYQPSDKSDITNNTTSSTDSESSTTSTQQRTDNTTDNSTHSGTNNDIGTRDDTSVHSGRIHGNIGVTTSQQMLQSELDIAKFNIVQQITDLFLTEFCIMIYT